MKKNTIIISLIMLLTLALSVPVFAATSSTQDRGKPSGDPMKGQMDTLVSSGVISQAQEDAVLNAIKPSDEKTSEKTTPAVGEDFSQVIKTKLDSLVSSGVITQAQEDAIQTALQPPAGGPSTPPNGGDGKKPGSTDDKTQNADAIVLKIGSSKMFVKGAQTDIDPGFSTAPVILNGTTFIPIRAVIESLGGTVEWSAADKKATVTLNNIAVVLQIGNLSATVNGSSKELNSAPYISDTGRTMLPLRFIAENLGQSVSWDDTTRAITIK